MACVGHSSHDNGEASMSLETKNGRKPGSMEGRYANQLHVGCNAYEFVMDFAQFFPENGETRVCARIITGPVYAKAFLETLRDSVERYEKDHGVIEDLALSPEP